ncbi:uncharacterized protein LOC100272472 [Zea mays]|uniref:Uncharacterized protein n=1 Tax=Zea mays TaxID=4577 RepID=B4FNU1_MAIZE|nr:uncharacterized protein LOC100272472 [Zea mays]ACF83784.1 unknown [Zea mays]AQK71927.1 hypothetical protein ZEAMMB73_Zm00001d016912 [Zea mays]|eukprot:NP_001140416.1 uncharacterized protein LOC100272472 [Zea mays]
MEGCRGRHQSHPPHAIDGARGKTAHLLPTPNLLPFQLKQHRRLVAVWLLVKAPADKGKMEHTTAAVSSVRWVCRSRCKATARSSWEAMVTANFGLWLANTCCRAPDYGSQGEVMLTFAENGSSKVGVRFDKQIPGAIDLGGSCELDHGLLCSVDSLCLDGPGWEDRAKHSFDVVFEFASEESQQVPVILFVKDVEKICGNNYTYHGLKNKLESFPAGVLLLGPRFRQMLGKISQTMGLLGSSSHTAKQQYLTLHFSLIEGVLQRN